MIKLKNANFDRFYSFGQQILQHTQAQNDLVIQEPILYQGYITSGESAFDRTRCRTLSEFFSSHNGWLTDPSLSKTRESLVRLTSIAIKAHFFLFQMDLLLEDPLVFWVPDLHRPNRDRFGLYCPFIKQKKALVVAGADLASLSTTRLSLQKFPVVLTSDSNHWLDHAHWKSLAFQSDYIRLLQDPFSVPDAHLARQHTDPETFSFGTLFKVPEDLRPIMRSAGLRSADGLGCMYLPKTFDLYPVQMFFDHLMKQRSLAQDDLQQLLHPLI